MSFLNHIGATAYKFEVRALANALYARCLLACSCLVVLPRLLSRDRSDFSLTWLVRPVCVFC
jgi:hypothetical protein